VHFDYQGPESALRRPRALSPYTAIGCGSRWRTTSYPRPRRLPYGGRHPDLTNYGAGRADSTRRPFAKGTSQGRSRRAQECGRRDDRRRRRKYDDSEGYFVRPYGLLAVSDDPDGRGPSDRSTSGRSCPLHVFCRQRIRTAFSTVVGQGREIRRWTGAVIAAGRTGPRCWPPSSGWRATAGRATLLRQRQAHRIAVGWGRQPFGRVTRSRAPMTRRLGQLNLPAPGEPGPGRSRRPSVPPTENINYPPTRETVMMARNCFHRGPPRPGDPGRPSRQGTGLRPEPRKRMPSPREVVATGVSARRKPLATR